jgi:hypothetical protein
MVRPGKLVRSPEQSGVNVLRPYTRSAKCIGGAEVSGGGANLE